MVSLLDSPAALTAIGILKSDFSSPGSLGPMSAAEFLSRSDTGFRTDRAGAVSELLRALGR